MIIQDTQTWKSRGFIKNKDIYLWDTLLMQEGFTICKKNDQDSSYESALATITSVLYDYEDALEMYNQDVLDNNIQECYHVGAYTFSNIGVIKNRIIYLEELSERCINDKAEYYVHRDKFGYANLDLYPVELGTVDMHTVKFDTIRNRWEIADPELINAIKIGDTVHINERRIGLITKGCIRMTDLNGRYLLRNQDLNDILNNPENATSHLL